MATKKVTLNELRSIVKQIIKEEVSDGQSINISLVTDEGGMGGAKSRENVTNQRKMAEALKRSVKVNFDIKYINEKGVVTMTLVGGTLTPISRGMEDNTRKPRPVAEVNVELYSHYAKTNANYEGRETVDGAIQMIMRYGQNSAENMVKNNLEKQVPPVSEGTKKITMIGLRNMIKEEISKGKY